MVEENLESKVNEPEENKVENNGFLYKIKNVIKKGFYTSLLIGSIACGSYAFGLDGFANSVAFPAAEITANKIEGKKNTLEGVTKAAISGVAMTPVFQYGWSAMEYVNPMERLPDVYTQTGSVGATLAYTQENVGVYAARTVLAGGAYIPVGVAANQAIDSTIENVGFGKVYHDLKTKWWRTTKKLIWQVTPLVMVNAMLVPVGFNVATGALVSFAYRVFAALGSRSK